MPENKNALEIHTLHRYFIWSDQMREHFRGTLGPGNIEIQSARGITTFLYMSYWYASLYVVIEGWNYLKIYDQRIDRLINNFKYVDLLKRYRNGVFHYQSKYFDERLIDFINEGEKTAIWANNIHTEFSRFFLKYFAQR